MENKKVIQDLWVYYVYNLLLWRKMKLLGDKRGEERAGEGLGQKWRYLVERVLATPMISPPERPDTCLFICLILATGAAWHLPAYLPDTRQLSRATPARSSAWYSPTEPRDTCLLIWRVSGRWAGRCHAAPVASIRQMNRHVSGLSGGEYHTVKSDGREEGGGFRIGNTCTPMEDSCWCMENQYNIVK